MSPRDAVNDFVGRHLLGLATTILAAGIGYGVLQAKVDAKADRHDVELLRAAVERIDERTARIERFLCQGRTDLGCAR